MVQKFKTILIIGVLAVSVVYGWRIIHSDNKVLKKDSSVCMEATVNIDDCKDSAKKD